MPLASQYATQNKNRLCTCRRYIDAPDVDCSNASAICSIPVSRISSLVLASRLLYRNLVLHPFAVRALPSSSLAATTVQSTQHEIEGPTGPPLVNLVHARNVGRARFMTSWLTNKSEIGSSSPKRYSQHRHWTHKDTFSACPPAIFFWDVL